MKSFKIIAFYATLLLYYGLSVYLINMIFDPMARHKPINTINILISFIIIASPALLIKNGFNRFYPKESGETMANGLGAMILLGMLVWIASVPEWAALNQRYYPVYAFNIILAFILLWYKKQNVQYSDRDLTDKVM